MFPLRRTLDSASNSEFPQKVARKHRLAGGAEQLISGIQPPLSPFSLGLCDALSAPWQRLTPVGRVQQEAAWGAPFVYDPFTLGNSRYIPESDPTSN